MRQTLNENMNFRGHLPTFGAEKAIKSGSFTTKKNAQTLSK